MELVGIACAFPMAAIASTAYSAFATFVLRRVSFVRRTILAGSIVVLVVFALELIALAIFGSVGARDRFGGTFLVVHTITLLLAAPAVANTFLLQDDAAMPWFVAAFWCFCVVIACVFLNIAVSEAWYGVDGMGGPYSR